MNPISASEALARLKAGNEKYVHEQYDKPIRLQDIAELDEKGQHPFATVLTCSDSRVPPELIFDCGLGEIFTIRTAGNVVSDYEIGSAEYAAEHLGTRLILVMGHSHCGAVASTVEEHGGVHGYLAHILREIEPSVDEARHEGLSGDALVRLAEDLNVRHTVKRLRENEVLRELPELLILGAKYDTHTGKVAFFE